MLLYFLIALSLSLTGVAGLQLMYTFYLDRLDNERKKRVRELEQQCKYLRHLLDEAETTIAEHERLISEIYPGIGDEEAWADVIGDR
jgi:hypothetical protein